jgi:hypothetical protein
MNLSGSFVFRISDFSLNCKDIEDNLPIKPTKIIKKGQLLEERYEAPYDIWSYEVKITDCENISNDLLILLEILCPYSEYIKKICYNNENVSINCYIRSLYGQIGFVINNKLFSKLVDLGLSLNFHILSFGDVED